MADVIQYAPGKRPPQGKAVSEWWQALPDWRTEYPRCENPPREDVAIYFTRKSDVSTGGELNTDVSSKVEGA